MRTPEFDDLMADLAPPDGPGAAVAVRLGGEVIHSAGYGLANVEWGVPIDTETVFRIGSITKQFTAAAILRLAAEGRLAIPSSGICPTIPWASGGSPCASCSTIRPGSKASARCPPWPRSPARTCRWTS